MVTTKVWRRVAVVVLVEAALMVFTTVILWDGDGGGEGLWQFKVMGW